MYIQIKSMAGPQNVGPDDSSIIISDKNITAIKHKNQWIYEAPVEASELEIPAFLSKQPYTVTINDAECSYPDAVRIVCTKDGRPLVPYYISDLTGNSRNNNKELSQLLEVLGISTDVNIDARFSISFPYASITFNNKLFLLTIEEYSKQIVEKDGNSKAIITTHNRFSGPVSVDSLYCAGCGRIIPCTDYSIHERHGVKFSSFAQTKDLSHYEKAIRAAYKKSFQRGLGATFIEKRKARGDR